MTSPRRRDGGSEPERASPGGRPGRPRRATGPEPGDGVLLAVDVGTSGARAAAFDLAGRRILEMRRGYPILSPRSGFAEQDPTAWRDASLAALGAAIRGLGPEARVLGIGLTGQCPSMALLDASGQPVGMGLMYRDNRAVEEADAIVARFGAREIHRRTGHLPAAFHILPKLLWLRAHEPAAFRAAVRVLQPRDLVAFALTGVEATEGTHAAATLLYDLRGGRWDMGLFGAFDLDPALFPRLRAPFDVVGELRPSLVRRFGLRASVPVVLGAADSQACAFGAGIVAPGPVSEMAGSSTCLNSVVVEPLDEVEVTHYAHVVPGVFTTETGLNTTGEAVRWLAGLVYGGRDGRAAGADYERLDAEAASVDPGSDGVLAIPAFADGERDDPGLRAAFTGLSVRHDRAVLARAVLEGVAHAMRDRLALLRRAGAPVDELRVSGGDTRLATWNRIKADVLGVPVVPVSGDAAAAGVAMLAGIGSGAYRDAGDAIRCAVHLGAPILPDPSVAGLYLERHEAWQRLRADDQVRRSGSGGPA